MGLHLLLKLYPTTEFLCGAATRTPYDGGRSWTASLQDWLNNNDRCEACVGELGEKLFGPLDTDEVMTHTTPAVTHLSDDDGNMLCGDVAGHYDRAKPLRLLKEWCNEPSPCEACRTALLTIAKGGV